MCGLAGFLGGGRAGGRESISADLIAMGKAISHRGPDGSGIWFDEESRVGLVHNRLAILDLSPAGDQPMVSTTGRFVLAYNGEIYNHAAIRSMLQESGAAHNWRGHSDTETLLAAVEAWGLPEALRRCTGMFALALWDRQEKTLFLARDRLGEKPLYYGWQGAGAQAAFLFGSELKALREHASFSSDIDRKALSAYTRFGYVPTPFSIYRDIFKLPPGCFLSLGRGSREPAVRRYWSGAAVAREGVANPHKGEPQDIVDELEKLLTRAVGRQMLSDVPLGAFLSGGVDSSLIVALMRANSPGRVSTFSIGFEEAAYNEAEHAKAVAAHLGTNHTELYVTADQAMATIPNLPAIYDEPFADSSQIPTILVSQLARRDVTVSLSGDGGDELFGGYNRYKSTAQHWRRMSQVPRSLRQAFAFGIRRLSPSQWDRIVGRFGNVLPSSLNMALPGEKIHKAAAVLGSRSADDLYSTLVSHWSERDELVVGDPDGSPALQGLADDLAGLSDVERMMALDMLTYLPDDILAKVDRAAMSVSLETRVPFLDHEVVEFAWRMPTHTKLRDGQTKWALRQILYRHVPSSLIERPKMGFGVPIDDWLRGPLKAWAEDLLSEQRLREEGYFNPAAVQRVWRDHQNGGRMQHRLWIVLMFQAWLDQQRKH